LDRLPGHSPAPPRILLLEDDPAIARTVIYALERSGLQVTHCLLVRDAQQQLALRPHDLLVLDVGLPDGSGLDLCRQVRAQGATPVLMLSAHGEEIDRVLGLELGADDYVTKPFSTRELLARIRAVLRRYQQAGAATDERRDERRRAFRFAGWELNLRTRRLTAPDGHRLELSHNEFSLLVAFCSAPQRVLTRDQLLELSRLHNAEVYDRTVDVQVLRLRRKIEADHARPTLIVTERGAGYRLATPVETLY